MIRLEDSRWSLRTTTDLRSESYTFYKIMMRPELSENRQKKRSEESF